MKSRERIRIALDHKEPDRVPIDLGSMRSTGISIIAYNNLRKKIDINNRLSKMYDFIQQLAYPEEEMLERFNIDVIDAGQAFLKNPENWKEWVSNDGSKCLIPRYLNIDVDEDEIVMVKNKEGKILGIKPKSSLYIDQTYWPMGDLAEIPKNINKDVLIDNVWSAAPAPP